MENQCLTLIGFLEQENLLDTLFSLMKEVEFQPTTLNFIGQELGRKVDELLMPQRMWQLIIQDGKNFKKENKANDFRKVALRLGDHILDAIDFNDRKSKKLTNATPVFLTEEIIKDRELFFTLRHR